MKKLFIVLAILLVATLIFAKDWTIMVYICGDNNLVGAVNGDIDEIEAAFTDDTDIDFIVQVDGMYYSSSERGYNDALTDNITTVRRYQLSPTGDILSGKIDVPPALSLGELNMADPNALIDFVGWSVNNYPADNYGLIIWNHGQGWIKGDGILAEVYSPMTGGTGEYVMIDNNGRGGVSDDTSVDAMCSCDTDNEWRTAMDGIRSVLGGNRLRFLGHDMCVMSYMEILWDERFVTEMIVASEANIAYYGWPYDSWITNLINNPSASNDQIGTWMVDDYASEYSGSDATLCYMDLIDGDVEGLREDVWNLAYTLVNNEGGRDDSEVNGCISSTMSMSSGTLWEDYRDLYLFCNEINNSSMSSYTKTVASNVQANISNLVEYAWAGGSFSGSYGLGLYLPTASVYWFPGGDDNGADTMAYEWSPWGGGYSYCGYEGGCEYWTLFIYGLTSTRMEEENYITNPTEFNTDPVIYYSDNNIYLKNIERVYVYDISGKRVYYDRMVSKGLSSIDMKSWAQGVYFVKGDNVTKKIVKVK